MYEYKVIPAPVRAGKVRGLKGTGERFSWTLMQALNEHGCDGWEYQRSESLPCEERSTFGRTRSSTQTVLIFRRALYGPEEHPTQGSGPTVGGEPPLTLHPGQEVEPDFAEPYAPRAEPSLRGAGTVAPTRDFPPLRGSQE